MLLSCSTKPTLLRLFFSLSRVFSFISPTHTDLFDVLNPRMTDVSRSTLNSDPSARWLSLGFRCECWSTRWCSALWCEGGDGVRWDERREFNSGSFLSASSAKPAWRPCRVFLGDSGLTGTRLKPLDGFFWRVSVDVFEPATSGIHLFFFLSQSVFLFPATLRLLTLFRQSIIYQILLLASAPFEAIWGTLCENDVITF